MDYFLEIIEKHKFAYILIVSAIATVLIVNNVLEFSERIINNHFLFIFSLVGFYILVWYAVKKELKERR